MSSPDNTERQVPWPEGNERQAEEIDLEQLARGIITSLAELKRRNKELEARNADLLSAIEQASHNVSTLEAKNTELAIAVKQANERIASLEQTAEIGLELVRKALRTAAEALRQAEKDIDSSQRVISLHTVEPTQEYPCAETLADLDPREREHLQALPLMAEKLEPISPSAEVLWPVADDSASLAVVQPEVDQFPRTASSETILELEAGVACQPASPTTSAMLDGLRLLTEQLTQLSEEPRLGEPTAIEPSIGPVEIAEPVASITAEDSAEPAATEQPAAAVAAEQLAEVGSRSAGATAETFELIASPFCSFASLSAFHHVLQQVQGVVETKARGFDKGTLRATVEYTGTTPLASRLLELPRFAVQIKSIKDREIEILLMDKSS